jgi:gliding motility-associated-like protein
LIANTQYNCADTIVKPITVKSIPLYWFPEAFTPKNSIGRNDEFGLTTPLTISDYEFRIFNRWGQLVFETRDVNEKWNGEFNGIECVPGQYIYTATFMSPEKDIQVHQGTVLLIK